MLSLSVQAHPNLIYAHPNGEPLYLDLYTPTHNGQFPIAIILHGGGWSSGDKTGDTLALTQTLNEAGFLCIAPNYRLAPAHPWPACFEDIQIVLAWTQTNATHYNGDPQRVALIGYSAGGQLACLAALHADEKTPIQAAVGLAAPTDLLADTHRRNGLSPSLQALLNATELTPEIEAQLKALSPLNAIHANTPPFLLVHGTADQSVPFNQSLTFRSKLQEAKQSCDLIILENAPHRISEWSNFDPHYTQKIIDWLLETLETDTP